MRCCFAQEISGKNWLMLTQQVLNLIQISDQFYNDVTLVRLMELLLIYPEVHPFNRNELTNRNMVRLKNRQCDLSATFFIDTGFEISHLMFYLLSRISFMALFLSGLCIDLRILLLGTSIRLHFPQPILVAFLSSDQLLLRCKKRPYSTKFSAKALIDVATFSTYSLCPILLYKSFHYNLMNDLVITEEFPRKFRNSLTDILGSLHDTERIIFRASLMPVYGHDAVPTSWISIVFLSGIVMEDDWVFYSQRQWKDWQELKEMRWKGCRRCCIGLSPVWGRIRY